MHCTAHGRIRREEQVKCGMKTLRKSIKSQRITS